MLNSKQYRAENTILILAVSIFFISLIAGLLFDESLFFIAPVAFLLGYQLVLNYKNVFYLLLISTPLSLEYYFDNGFSTDIPTEPLMILLMLTLFFLLLLKKEKIDIDFIKHPITTMLFIHFFWILIATAFSQDISISIKYVLAKTWYIATFYFVAGLIIKSTNHFKTAFWCLFIPTLFVAIYALINHMHYNFRFADVNKTMLPFFRNHVNYAVFLALMFPFLFLASTWYEKYSWQKMLINVSKVILLLAIYLSYTRASWLSVVAAGMSFFLIRKGLLKYGIVATVCAVVIFISYMLINNNYLKYAPDFTKTIYHGNLDAHMESTLTLEDVSSAERIYRWVAAEHMIRDKPIAGFGPEEFYSNYKNYTVNKFETYISRNEEHSTVHNYYLEMTVEQGFPGLLIWLGLIITVLLTGQRAYLIAHNAADKRFVLVLTLSFITILINISLSDLIEADKIGTSFFMIMAMLVNMDIYIKRKNATSQIS